MVKLRQYLAKFLVYVRTGSLGSAFLLSAVCFQNCSGQMASDSGKVAFSSMGGSTAGTGITILAQPLSQQVDVGTNVTISVSAMSTSYSPLSYQWKKNGTSLVNPLGAQSPNLSFTASSSSQGSYTVTVTDGVASVTSNPAYLSVNSVSNGALVAVTVFQGQTASCSYTLPSKSFTAPVTGIYTLVGYVSAPGNYYYLEPNFKISDNIGNQLLGLEVDNSLCCAQATFYDTKATAKSYLATTVISLNAGQVYNINQYYGVRSCYNNQTGTVTLGIEGLFYGVPIGGNCAATGSLPSASQNTLASGTMTSPTGATCTGQFICFGGQWGSVSGSCQ